MRLNRHIVVTSLLAFAVPGLSSCESNYLIGPVPTPAFTHPWQSSVGAHLTVYDKLLFDAAASLPKDFVISVAHESWGHGLDNDQEMTSFGAGKFWAKHSNIWLVLAGFGYGSQRTGPAYPYSEYQGFMQAPRAGLPPNADLGVQYLDGNSKFRKYFIEATFTHTSQNYGFATPYTGEVKSSWGFISRLEYLDRYQYLQSISEVVDTTGFKTFDTTFSIDQSPNHILSLDFGGFVSASIPYIDFAEVYAEVLFRRVLNGDADYQDIGTACVGLRLTF